MIVQLPINLKVLNLFQFVFRLFFILFITQFIAYVKMKIFINPFRPDSIYFAFFSLILYQINLPFLSNFKFKNK